MKMLRGQVRQFPYLFRNQADPACKFLQRAEIGTRVIAGSKFVVPGLAGEQRPRSPHTPVLVSPSIRPLAVAVVVVTAPAGAVWRFNFQHSIDNAERVLNDGVVRSANPVTDQFEKPRIHDLSGGKFILPPSG